MDKDIKKGFFVEPDDFENFKKNGDLLISSFEYVINEKFGMKYFEFYHFIYPYISYSERMLAKYEILELTSSLYKKDIEIKNLLLEESEFIFNEIIQTKNLQPFLKLFNNR